MLYRVSPVSMRTRPDRYRRMCYSHPSCHSRWTPSYVFIALSEHTGTPHYEEINSFLLTNLHNARNEIWCDARRRVATVRYNFPTDPVIPVTTDSPRLPKVPLISSPREMK